MQTFIQKCKSARVQVQNQAIWTNNGVGESQMVTPWISGNIGISGNHDVYIIQISTYKFMTVVSYLKRFSESTLSLYEIAILVTLTRKTAISATSVLVN